MNELQASELLESDVAAAFEHGKQAIQVINPPAGLHDAEAAVVIPNDSQLVEFPEKKLPQPEFLEQTVTFHDVESFTAYVNAFKDGATIIFKDTARHTFTAVLDYHAAPQPEEPMTLPAPRHCDHVARLIARKTPEWNEWLNNNDKAMNQVQFAEWIEDHQDDIINPSPQDMQHIAMNLEAKNGVDFKQAVRLDNGEAQFKYEETVKGTVVGGALEIPKEIEIAISPFEGCKRYPMKALFRYRISSGGLNLRYKLLGHQRALELMFEEMDAEIAKETTIKSLNGSH